MSTTAVSILVDVRSAGLHPSFNIVFPYSPQLFDDVVEVHTPFNQRADL